MFNRDNQNLIRLYESVYDDNTHYDYLEGNCASLALKLHDLTGWPINVLSNPEGEEWLMGDEEEGIEYTHIVIEHPSGKYFDTKGLRTNREIAEDFGLEYLDSYEISRDQLINLLSDDGPFDCYLDESEVQRYAEYLAKKYQA
jgi:hypothetical protein